MKSQISGAAIKTQSDHRGNAEYAAMLVVVGVVREGLLEGKSVCAHTCVLFNGVWVESAITQNPLQLEEEKESTVSRSLTHTQIHT